MDIYDEIERRGRKRERRRWLLGVVAFMVLIYVVVAVYQHLLDVADRYDERMFESRYAPSVAVTTQQPTGLNTKYPPERDVEIRGCNFDKHVLEVSGKLRVMNHTPVPADYLVEVVLIGGAGDRIGFGYGSIDRLKPGKRASVYFFSYDEISETEEGVTCELGKVTRLPKEP